MSLSYENAFSCSAEPLGSRINKFFLLLIINTVTCLWGSGTHCGKSARLWKDISALKSERLHY